MNISTKKGILDKFGEGLQLSTCYTVETTRKDIETKLDFSNIHSQSCESLEYAIWLSQEWQKAGYNNISISLQIKRNDELLIQDSAYNFEFSNPKIAQADKLQDEVESLQNELEIYKMFVHKHKADEIFESFRSPQIVNS